MTIPATAVAPEVHPTALIDPSAELAPGVVVGPYSIVGPNVRVGALNQQGTVAYNVKLVRIGQNWRIEKINRSKVD